MKILLHPVLVHFPIAFYFLELLLLALWISRQDEAYHRFAEFSFGIGYLFMLISILAGLSDAGGFVNIHGLTALHAYSAAGIFIIYTLRGIYWRLAGKDQPGYALVQCLGALAGNGMIAYTSYRGGRLVYS